MRDYTHTYNKARQARAKPIILAIIGTDIGRRAYGKEMPKPAYLIEGQPIYIGTSPVYIGSGNQVLFEYQSSESIFEWEPRVLDFGDFRQTLSQNSESILESMTEKTMDSHTITLDNADGKLTEITSKEVLLNGYYAIKQGFDYPDFGWDDFITLFTGSIQHYDVNYTRCTISADQAITTTQPEDPDINLTTTYCIKTSGSSTSGASGSNSYSNLSGNIYAEESWTEVLDVYLEDPTQACQLFAIENQAYSQNRFVCGIDSGRHLYVSYTGNVNTASPSYTTVTSDFTLNAGHNTLTINFDTTIPQVTLSDGSGQSYEEGITGETTLTFDSSFGSYGTGNGQFQTNQGLAIDSSGYVYVTDTTQDNIQKFTSAGSYVSQFGSSGSGNGQFNWPVDIAFDSSNYIFVTDQLNSRVQVFDTAFTYVTEFAVPGPRGIAINNSLGIIYVCTSDQTVERWTTALVYIDYFGIAGSAGAANGQFNNPQGICVASNGTVYVADYNNHRIQYFSSDGVYLGKWGSSGSGDGQFNHPIRVTQDADLNILVSDHDNYRIQIFDTVGAFVTDEYTTIGKPTGLDYYNNQLFFSSRYSTDVGVEIFDISSSAAEVDFSDTGSSDIINMSTSFPGRLNWLTHNGIPLFSPVNKFDTPVDFGLSLGGDAIFLPLGQVQTDANEYVDQGPLTAFEQVAPGTVGSGPGGGGSGYSNPGDNQQNLILPLPYGDLTENSDSGVWVCPQIGEKVYCAAGWPVLSVANGNVVSVYVDGVLQSSGYTFDESNNYESQGNIAIITFSADQGDATVSVRMKGKETSEGSGVLITNPIDVIEDWMDYCSNLLTGAVWEKDNYTFTKAKALADSYNYTCAGVIQSNNTLGFWIQSILNSFVGWFQFSSTGALKVFLREVVTVSSVQEFFDEYEAIQLDVSKDLGNVLNRIIINYAVCYAKIDRRFKEGGESSYFRTADETTGSDTASIKRYGVKLPEPFNFDWTRKTMGVELAQSILLGMYNTPEFVVRYTGQDFKWVPLELNDQVQGTISLVRDSDNEVVEDVVYELREKTQNLDDFTTSFVIQSLTFIDLAEGLLYDGEFYFDGSKYFDGEKY